MADRQLLADALEKLTQREREIITLRFGLGGRREHTQKEVADRMGISQSYISRLEKRIIGRLKREILKVTRFRDRGKTGEDPTDKGLGETCEVSSSLFV